MPATPQPNLRLLAPAQVAEILGVTVEEVVALVQSAQLRGVRVGAAASLRIAEQSVTDYLDDQAELERLRALWHESNEASFPELWGTGVIRHGD